MKHAQATGLVIAILIAAAAAGFGVYAWMRPLPNPATPTLAAATQSPAANPIPTLTPEQALAISLNDLNGKSHALADWRGKVVLVNFWATWCPPCREEVPLLVKMQAKYAAQGLQIVGIATDEQSEQDVRSFVKKMVVNYPILMSDNQSAEIVNAFGGNFIGLPETIVLNRDGSVFKTHTGELEPKEAEDLVLTALKLPIPPTSHAPSSTTSAY